MGPICAKPDGADQPVEGNIKVKRNKDLPEEYANTVPSKEEK